MLPVLTKKKKKKHFKDTLKAFDNFKRKQKAYEVMFLIYKFIYILEVYSISDTMRY